MATTAVDEEVSARVRGKLAEKRARQADLAEAIGMSQPSLSRRLSGVRAFTIGEVHRVADYLGVTPDTLLAPP